MKTTIEWTGTPAADGRMLSGFSFNPWRGCTRWTEGCQFCYAEAFSHRLGEDLWGKGKERRLAPDGYWQKPLAWDARAARLGVRLKVFCASMADVFDAEVPPEWRLRLWDLIARTPHLDWLLLTKRPENWREMVPWHPERPDVAAAIALATVPVPHNVWLGATVENERRAGERRAAIDACPAAVRFLSLEPLLGPVDVTPYLGVVDWLIIGGESGNSSRPCEIDWMVDIVRQAQAGGIACFVKQLGSRPTLHTLSYDAGTYKGGEMEYWPNELKVRQWPTPRIAV